MIDSVRDGTARDAGLSSPSAQILAAVERSAVRHDPFDHLYMENILDAPSYRALLEALPDRARFNDLLHPDALRPDGSSTRLRMYLYPEMLWRLPAAERRAWLPIARLLTSDALRDAFRNKFRAALEERFGRPVETIGLYPVPILLRDQPGYRIGLHSDVATKAITVQFYLPRDESQRHLGTLFHKSDSGPDAEEVTRMPFLPASGYAFPVASTKSWHSARTVGPEDGERVTMMITYYVADALLAQLRYRLRRLAMNLGYRRAG